MISARELRFAFIFDDYETALHLFRDVLQLETEMDLEHEGARGVILRVPSATLELFERDYGRHVDEVEVGRPLDYTVRVAVNIESLSSDRRGPVAGVRPVADPVETPWGDRNRRFETSNGLQLTLFQPPD